MAIINDNIINFTGAIQHKRGSLHALIESHYVPRPGELLVATDTGEIRVGDGTHSWSDLPAPIYAAETFNSFDADTEGKALDALKGKELNERVSVLEGVIGIDCGEISAPNNQENNGI